MNQLVTTKKVLLLTAVLGVVFACNLPDPTSPENSTQEPPAPIQTAATNTAEAAPTSIPKVTLVTTGETEIVFNWRSDRCQDLDIPDLPARAFRDAEGNVQLISTHLDNRRFIGPTLDDVKHNCKILMKSAHDGNPALYNDNTWIASPYTEDGQTIYAIVHQEFHGWEHGEKCPKDNFGCWFNALTLFISTDAGETYQPAAEPPNQLVATLPNPYEAGAGPSGVFEPSNIIKKDDYYYMFIRIDEFKSDAQRICLIRTNDLSDPAAWRAWDGKDFTIQNVDPYKNPELIDGAKKCTAMDSNIGLIGSSITYNTDLNLYVLVGISTDNFSTNREIWGVMYAVSPDLIHWQRRTLLFEMEVPWTYKYGDGNIYLYPSLLDPDSSSRNFETTDDTAYLYLTRFYEDFHLHRDLIRIPVQFFTNKEEARQAEVPFVP